MLGIIPMDKKENIWKINSQTIMWLFLPKVKSIFNTVKVRL